MSAAGKFANYRSLLKLPSPRRASNFPQSVLLDRNDPAFIFNNNQLAALDAAAEKNSVRLTPASLLYSSRASDAHQLVRSAQYLHRELPVRIAHRVSDFRALPFVAGCNPTVLAVHRLYMRAFEILSKFPPVTTAEDEARYSRVLRQLLDDHKDVVTMLAEGFRVCGRRDPDLTRKFLDRMLTSRLGIRLLCEHHLALRHNRADFIGLFDTKFCPQDVLKARANLVAEICEFKYGQAPQLLLDGSVRRDVFPYIPQPVEYMLTELLKNAYRATVEFNRGRPGPLPEVRVTIANNDVDFVFRISDQGGGVPHKDLSRIFEYNFSTAESGEEQSSFLDRVSEFRTSGPMHGFGFGLPLTRAYAKFHGGSLTFESLQGVGSDFYLRLKHIDGKGKNFRI